MPDKQATPPPEFTASKAASVQANADEVHRTATRPWFTKKRFILPLAVICLLAIIWGATGLGDTGVSRTAKSGSPVTVTNAPQVKAAIATMGTKVRDGEFEFVVTGVEHPGKTLAGKVGETLTAHGEFVIVVVNVTNIGKADRAPSCSCQILMNDKGQMFKPSSSILRTKEALKFVQLITPGNTVNGVLMLFDVAPGTNVVNIQLHDSPVSSGVNVKLA
jgi:Domain of unknown function (DUF4352)